MTREELKKIFPDATDEQITNTLNSFNTEKSDAVKNAGKNISDDELNKLKEKAKAYDDAEKEKMTAEQKYEALIKEAETAKAEAAKIRAKTKAEAEFIKAGLAESEYKDLLDDVIADDDEKTLARVGRFVGLIKAKTEAAIKTTTENLMKNGMQPKSDNGGKDENQKDTDPAMEFAKKISSSATKSEDLKKIVDYYT